jgi:hypothetical protein
VKRKVLDTCASFCRFGRSQLLVVTLSVALLVLMTSWLHSPTLQASGQRQGPVQSLGNPVAAQQAIAADSTAVLQLTNSLTSTLTLTELAPAGTPTPAQHKCIFSKGFWKNHSEVWPVMSLTIGGVIYTQQELLDKLRTPPRGDATYILIHQLIATLLNEANGADTSVVAQTIADAQAFLVSYPPGSDPANPDRHTALDLASTLDQFNESQIGPVLCGFATTTRLCRL